MSGIDALGAAAVSALNAANWSQDFTAVYKYVPDFRLEELGTQLQCVVVPAAKRTVGRLDRRRSRFDLVLDVGFCRRLEGVTDDVVRPWIQFVESVQTWFDELQTALNEAQYQSSEFDPLYDAARLRADSVFFSVLSVTYRAN